MALAPRASRSRPHAPAAALVAVVALAGCLAPGALGPDGADPTLAPEVVPAFAQDHDHLDPALHAFAEGLARVAYHNLVPGADGADVADPAARGTLLSSEIIVRGDYAYVGYIGGPWRLAIVDISDAERPELVGVWRTGGAWTMDVAVSDDGDWVFLSLTTAAIGALFARDYLVQDFAAPDGPAGPGLAVVDARDRASPKLAAFLPMHGLGPHTAAYHRFPDGREVVFASKEEGNLPGNAIVAVDVVPTPDGSRALVPLSVWWADDTSGMIMPHDVDVQEHPITGETLLYSAYFEGGLIVLDVSDPADPRLVGRARDMPFGEVAIHDAHPFPRLVGGRHFTFTAPEIVTGDATGHLRVWDTTDPAAPVHVGAWTLPGGFVVDRDFNFSPHNFQFLPDGRIALAHGHAGVWILDWLGPGGEAAPDPAWTSAPRAVAYHVPHAEVAAPPAWDPVHGAPWVWGTAVDARGLVWATDIVSGLHGLRVTVAP